MMTMQSRCGWFLILAALTASVVFVSCCKAGYWGEYCTNRCNSTCFNKLGCSPSEGKCHRCESGTWGDYCDETCPTKCDYCYQPDGSCVWCNPGYWGRSCDKECNTNCDSSCIMDIGSCFKCKNGFWGRVCDKTCPNGCLEATCDKLTGACKVCKDGFWGENCTQCNNACTGSLCHNLTGYCNECENGYWGHMCTSKCGDKCKRCSMITGKCITCADTFWGTDCIMNCSENCITCLNDSHCMSCIDGYYGVNKCNKTCPSECLEGQCTIYGECYLGCNVGYFGKTCDRSCNEHCLVVSNTTSCSYADGKCLHGCNQGFTNEFCSQVVEPVQEIAERETEKVTQQQNIIIGLSVTLGVILSIVACTTILYCTTHRRSHRRPPVVSELPAASVPIELQTIRPLSEDHNYAYILDPQNEQPTKAAASVLGGISGPYTNLKKQRVEGRENTTNGQNTTEATLLGFGDHVYVRNTSTDNTDTKSAYLTAVFQHPVVGEERGARAGLGSPGRNTATTNQEADYTH